MLTLSVIGVEDGAIIASSESGDRFRIPVDETTAARLRDARPEPTARRLSPREIQTQVRAGLTAQQVATLTGAPLPYIERFVGPVLAELEYVVDSALAVRVKPEDPEEQPRTFRAVMTERLQSLDATGVKWSSCKEAAGGWVLVLGFTADEIEHEARWRYDAKTQSLTPHNTEASTLSQAGRPAALTPRLRAIEPTTPIDLPAPEGGEVIEGGFGDRAGRDAAGRRAEAAPTEPERQDPAPEPEPSRFDSAVFTFPAPLAEDAEPDPDGAAAEPSRPTTDLLSALAKKRGNRSTEVEPMHEGDDEDDEDPFRTMPAPERETPAPVSRGRFPEQLPPPPPREPARPLGRTRATRHGGTSARSAPRRGESAPPSDDAAETAAEPADAAPQRPTAVPPPAPPATAPRPRRGRTTMPSWDEIVYGKDDD